MTDKNTYLLGSKISASWKILLKATIAYKARIDSFIVQFKSSKMNSITGVLLLTFLGLAIFSIGSAYGFCLPIHYEFETQSEACKKYPDNCDGPGGIVAAVLLFMFPGMSLFVPIISLILFCMCTLRFLFLTGKFRTKQSIFLTLFPFAITSMLYPLLVYILLHNGFYTKDWPFYHTILKIGLLILNMLIYSISLFFTGGLDLNKSIRLSIMPFIMGFFYLYLLLKCFYL